MFIWNRVRPDFIATDVLDEALRLLTDSQLKSGGWPTYQDESEPSLLSTCAAIHALAIHRPVGWNVQASRAADWLESQQTEEGFWDIDDGPTVRITVLVLDSIELARGGDQITFKLNTDVGTPSIGKSDTGILNFQERNDVIECLSKFRDIVDSQSRQSFLVRASLGYLIPDLDMGGSTRDFAARIVGLTESRGELPNEPEMHCLGALLFAAQALQHISPATRSLLADVIIKYDLVDIKRLDELRKRSQN